MCCNIEPMICGYYTDNNKTLVHIMKCPKCNTTWEEKNIPKENIAQEKA